MAKKSDAYYRELRNSLIQRSVRYAQTLDYIYDVKLGEIARLLAKVDYDGDGKFTFKDYNVLDQVEKLMLELEEEAQILEDNGIYLEYERQRKDSDAWLLAFLGFSIFAAMRVSEKETKKRAKEYARSIDNMKGRVWNSKVREKMEEATEKAILDDRPVNAIKKSLRAALDDDCRRNMRFISNQSRMAYREADYEQFSQNPYIIGIEILLGTYHPKYDMCDELQGIYPKDFKWKGWHPNCCCIQRPVFVDPSVIERAQNGEDVGGELEEMQTEDTPKNFKDYLDRNAARIEMANLKGYTPFWVKDNIQYTELTQHQRGRAGRRDFEEYGRKHYVGRFSLKHSLFDGKPIVITGGSLGEMAKGGGAVIEKLDVFAHLSSYLNKNSHIYEVPVEKYAEKKCKRMFYCDVPYKGTIRSRQGETVRLQIKEDFNGIVKLYFIKFI